jgi:hypothetical protein
MIKYYTNSNKTIFYKLREHNSELIEVRLDLNNLSLNTFDQLKEETLSYFESKNTFKECTETDWKLAFINLYKKL